MQTCNTLLIVDDMQINRMILRAMFEDEYVILEAEDGEQAMTLLRRNRKQITAVLLDLLMPVRDGYAVLKDAAADEQLSHIPIIVITADHTPESEVRVFELGASDIITKPFESRSARRRICNAVELYQHKLHLEELVDEQAAQIRESNAALVDGLSSVIEHRSLESGQHIRRIRGFTQILLQKVTQLHPEYGLSEQDINIISSASSLHDIGKIAIPDAILNKPGRLTAEEFEVMQTHTIRGCEILSSLGRIQEPEYLDYAYSICRYHHERWDGGGYPEGLKENSIPLCAQVVSVADCFDALTTDRVYKKAIPLKEAYQMILQGECGAFSPTLLECFEDVQPAFFDLARRYADGLRQVEILPEPEPRHVYRYENGKAAQEQDRLFALLRYLDATVLEFDQSAGTYHLLYQADRNFFVFQKEQPLKDAGEAFAQACVHPDDRDEAVSRLCESYRRFFADGSLEISGSCRIMDRDSGQYLWYRNSVLRLDASDPRRCRALSVWSRLTDTVIPAEAPLPKNPDDTLRQQACYTCNRFPIAMLSHKYDQDFHITAANQTFLNLIGYTESELKELFHSQLLELLPPAERDLVRSSVRRQMTIGRELQLEYRIVTKQGKTLWFLENAVLRRDGSEDEYFQSTLSNITRQKRVQEELRQTLERYRVAVHQVGTVVFEWNLITDQLWLSGNWEPKFGYPPANRLSDALTSNSHVYPMDVRNIRKAIAAVQDGALRGEAEFRLISTDGRYRWHRASFTVQLNGEGKPSRSIGVIMDIELEKQAIEGLLDQAQRDSLTGLYHKSAAKERIDFYLKQMTESDMSALLLVDVDDFRSVNDQYGHIFGDAILAELSNIFKRFFQGSDVVARVGGDEFLAFMPAVPSEAMAISRVCQLLAACESVTRGADYQFSCSIGITLFPQHGQDYETLFEHSSRALYQAKSAGKGRYVIYSEDGSRLPCPGCAPPLERTKIDPETDFQLPLSHIISRLYQDSSPDYAAAVDRALEGLGSLFHVSRVYIFEDSDNGDALSNTFEWCCDSAVPLKYSLQNILYEDLGADYRENFDQQGIFACQDAGVLTPRQHKLLGKQDMLSMLQCAVVDEGRFLGFMGFDDCQIRRLWVPAQINAVSFAAKMIFAYLQSRRGTALPEPPEADL